MSQRLRSTRETRFVRAYVLSFKNLENPTMKRQLEQFEMLLTTRNELSNPQQQTLPRILLLPFSKLIHKWNSQYRQKDCREHVEDFATFLAYLLTNDCNSDYFILSEKFLQKDTPFSTQEQQQLFQACLEASMQSHHFFVNKGASFSQAPASIQMILQQMEEQLSLADIHYVIDATKTSFQSTFVSEYHQLNPAYDFLSQYKKMLEEKAQLEIAVESPPCIPKRQSKSL